MVFGLIILLYGVFTILPKTKMQYLFTLHLWLFAISTVHEVMIFGLVLKVFEPNFSWPNALPDANHQMLMHWAKAQCISLILSLSTS